MGQHVKLMIVTAMGMVFGASLFGLYRFVGAESPKQAEDAGWVSPGVARSGPTVTIEKSSAGSPPVTVPSLPPVPTQSPLELPQVRQADVVPAALEMPMIPTPPVGPASPPPATIPAVPVEVKPPTPGELPGAKPAPPPAAPRPNINPPPAIPSIPALPSVPSTPPTPSVSGPTELGPFKLASSEQAPAPRVRTTSTRPQPASPTALGSSTLPLGPTAPLAPPPPSDPRVDLSSRPMLPSLPAPMLPEKPLQPELPSHTLNAGGVTPMSPALPVPDVATSKPGPFLPEPKPTVPLVNYPAPMLPAPGVEPMPLPTRELMMSTALGVALALTPATTPILAQGPNNPPPIPASTPGDEPKKQEAPKAALDEETKKLLDELRKDVATIKAAQKDFQSLILGKENSTNLADMGILKRLTELESRVAKLDEALRKLESAMKDATNKIVAAYPGSPGSTPPAAPMAPPPGSGTAPATPAPSSTKAYIRIVNDYPAEMSILINDGKSYRVASGTAQLVEVPPGSYKYELLHTGAQPKIGTIKEGETITLRIN